MDMMVQAIDPALDVDLELDPDFAALERAVRSRPEVQYGNVIEPAQPADWTEAQRLAESLMTRTLDLRVMVLLAIARLHVAGPAAFGTTLTDVRQAIEAHWDHVHPRLDPEDDNDPIQRGNALGRLADPALVLRPLRDAELASYGRGQRVCWRDIAVSEGDAQTEAEPGRKPLTETDIRRAFAETDRTVLEQRRDGVSRALDEARAILVGFDAHTRGQGSPKLEELIKLLGKMRAALARYEPLDDAPAIGALAEEAAAEHPAGEDAAAPPSAVVAAPRAAILDLSRMPPPTRREDALRLLDLACSYFRTQEPSSPVPLLLDRARRLASMDFLDILRDLAPDGLGQAQNVAGPPAPE